MASKRSDEDFAQPDSSKGISNNYYQIEKILSDKVVQSGNKVEKRYQVLWAPTWEPEKIIRKNAPLLVEEYENRKSEAENMMTNFKVTLYLVVVTCTLIIRYGKGMVKVSLATKKPYLMKFDDLRANFPLDLVDFLVDCVEE
ncbi:unnamed protein product [Dracunculus medinensis]|uniref:Chromo domain-containing protein n=1 Tax=Dracunculus medinensis TaxID=318479 RepID=A0A0N4U0V0_DRAME|nr:unnamed protein product [Dracunculus medinensis]